MRKGLSKAHFTPLDVLDVYSRGDIRDLDGAFPVPDPGVVCRLVGPALGARTDTAPVVSLLKGDPSQRRERGGVGDVTPVFSSIWS